LHWTVRADGNPINGGSGIPVWALKVSYANGRFIAVSAWGGTSTSTNGTSWIHAYVPTQLYLNGATFGGGRYVAVGEADFGAPATVSNIVTSTDGVTWTLRRSHPTEGGRILDVTYGAGLFVAIGADDGFTYTSPNATTWTKRNILGGHEIGYYNNIFIVPYNSGTNLVSADGINWAVVNTGVSNLLGKPMLANGVFMARAGSPYIGLGPYLVTSTDGTNWAQYSQTLPGRSLATDGACLVSVSSTPTNVLNYNSFVYSSDTLVSLRMANTAPPTVMLSGLVGRSYRIEAKDDLADTNVWQPLITLQLPNTPYLFTDSTATNSSQRFYRGVLLP
jgi:hypothetical protein